MVEIDNSLVGGFILYNLLSSETNILYVEIREIDGDMKTLVYENYNKFISATDTIRKVCFNRKKDGV